MTPEFEYKEDYVNIFIDLTTGTIIYKDILIKMISKCHDISYLKDYSERFEEYVKKSSSIINQSQVEEIRQELKTVIEELEREKELMSEELKKHIQTFKQLTENQAVPEENYNNLQRYIKSLTDKRTQGIPLEENDLLLLDDYMLFLRDVEPESKELTGYDKQNTEGNQKEQTPRVLKLTPKDNDHLNKAGFIKIVYILDTVIMTGIVIGILLVILAFTRN